MHKLKYVTCARLITLTAIQQKYKNKVHGSTTRTITSGKLNEVGSTSNAKNTFLMVQLYHEI